MACGSFLSFSLGLLEPSGRKRFWSTTTTVVAAAGLEQLAAVVVVEEEEAVIELDFTSVFSPVVVLFIQKGEGGPEPDKFKLIIANSVELEMKNEKMFKTNAWYSRWEIEIK